MVYSAACAGTTTCWQRPEWVAAVVMLCRRAARRGFQPAAGRAAVAAGDAPQLALER